MERRWLALAHRRSESVIESDMIPYLYWSGDLLIPDLYWSGDLLMSVCISTRDTGGCARAHLCKWSFPQKLGPASWLAKSQAPRKRNMCKVSYVCYMASHIFHTVLRTQTNVTQSISKSCAFSNTYYIGTCWLLSGEQTDVKGKILWKGSWAARFRGCQASGLVYFYNMVATQPCLFWMAKCSARGL